MNAIRSILVPFDFSLHSESALEAATSLARQIGGSSLHLLHVLVPPAYIYAGEIYTGGVLDQIVERTRSHLEEVAAGISNPPGPVEVRVVEGGQISETIDGVAEQIGADLIVMGTHGRTGLAHVFLGSVAERTLRRAPCPVMTVRAQPAVAKDAPEPVGAGEAAPAL